MTWIDAHVNLDDLHGGRFRSTHHIKPRAWAKPGLGLRDIIENWGDGDASFPHVVSEAKLRVLTAPNGDRRICPVPTDLDAWLSISSPFIRSGETWIQPSPGTFTRVGNLLSAVTPNVNTYITHAGHYIKAGFLLKGGWLPPQSQFAFRVGTQGLTRNGGVLSYAGRPELIVRPPVVYDWQNPDDTRPIAWEFVQLGGLDYILFTLPSLTGMSLPVVDPTFTDGYGGDVQTYKDTKVRSDLPTRNYGVATTTSMASNDKPLCEFDLSSIPESATCDSATVYYYQAGSAGAAAWTVSVYSIAIGNDAWIEGTQNNTQALAGEPCWNALAADGAGGVTTPWAGSAGLLTSGIDYEASSIGSFSGNRSDANGTEYSTLLTAARIEGWFGASNTNHGILLTTTAWAGALGLSDHATPGYRPKLVVNWTAAGGGSLVISLSRKRFQPLIIR